MSELNNLWNLAKTGFAAPKQRSKKELLIFSLKILLVLAFFKIATFGLAYLLQALDIFHIPANLNRSRLGSYSDIEILLIVAVYAPIVEELTYRLPLKFSKLNFTISIVGLNLVLLRNLWEIEYVYSFLISIAIGTIIYIFLQPIRIKQLEDLWAKYKLCIFYFLLFFYTLLHLRNYEITTELLLFSPIVILPKFLGALVFSYIRLSSGIIMAICFHAFNNGILKVISLILN